MMMKNRQRHDDYAEAEKPLIDVDVKRSRMLFDLDGTHPVSLDWRCCLQHAAVVLVVVMVATLVGVGFWYMQNDESIDLSKVHHARQPW